MKILVGVGAGLLLSASVAGLYWLFFLQLTHADR